MDVTIVGAGRYAKHIVGPKYRAHPACWLKAIVSPSASQASLAGTSLAATPVVRSFAEWRQRFGPPTASDVVDFCVHTVDLLAPLVDAADAGVSRVILPKPIAVTRAALNELMAVLARQNVWATVASQWHYAPLTQMLAQTVAACAHPIKVHCEFSQMFGDDQLCKYTPVTALLPHMLQIVADTGIMHRVAGGPMKVELHRTSACVTFKGLGGSDRLTLVTDLRAKKTMRVLRITDEAGQQLIVADFLASYKDGIAQKLTSLTWNGARTIFPEDNVEGMLSAIMGSVTCNTPCLTVEDYLPVAKLLLRIVDHT